MKTILNWIKCNLLAFHNWTCKANEGIDPLPGEDFWVYAIMYCKDCNKISDLSKKELDKPKNTIIDSVLINSEEGLCYKYSRDAYWWWYPIKKPFLDGGRGSYGYYMNEKGQYFGEFLVLPTG